MKFLVPARFRNREKTFYAICGLCVFLLIVVILNRRHAKSKEEVFAATMRRIEQLNEHKQGYELVNETAVYMRYAMVYNRVLKFPDGNVFSFDMSVTCRQRSPCSRLVPVLTRGRLFVFVHALCCVRLVVCPTANREQLGPKLEEGFIWCCYHRPLRFEDEIVHPRERVQRGPRSLRIRLSNRDDRSRQALFTARCSRAGTR